jgi:hypothetical protein
MEPSIYPRSSVRLSDPRLPPCNGPPFLPTETIGSINRTAPIRRANHGPSPESRHGDAPERERRPLPCCPVRVPAHDRKWWFVYRDSKALRRAQFRLSAMGLFGAISPSTEASSSYASRGLSTAARAQPSSECRNCFTASWLCQACLARKLTASRMKGKRAEALASAHFRPPYRRLLDRLLRSSDP